MTQVCVIFFVYIKIDEVLRPRLSLLVCWNDTEVTHFFFFAVRELVHT